jgi:hypothetical protein
VARACASTRERISATVDSMKPAAVQVVRAPAIPTTKLRRMARPRGAYLNLDGAEQFTATIPRDLAGDPAATALTIEAMLCVEEFAGWGYPGNPTVLGVSARYDSWLGWRQGMWDRARAPALGGGAGAIVGSEKFAAEFPRGRWCHVRITWDGRGQARFYVDGKVFGEGAAAAFKPGAKEPLVYSLGPVRGYVDEVRIRKEATK